MRASVQKRASRVLESLQASTPRVAQSMTSHETSTDAGAALTHAVRHMENTPAVLE